MKEKFVKCLAPTAVAFGMMMSLFPAAVFAAPSETTTTGTNYTYYRYSNNTSDVVKTTTFGEVYMGGGTDVDAAFNWMINKANGGDFLIIRATGTSAYDQYVYDLATAQGKPLNSVSTLLLKGGDNAKLQAAATDSAVVDKINKAEAIFFAGGNQADYAQFLKITGANSAKVALNNRITTGIPFGGTSAGTMIQGQFTYDAISAGSSSLDSTAALSNPYNSLMSFTKDLVTTPVNAGIQTDTHFEQRDRMGRFLTFLARNIKDGWTTTAKGIAVNEQSALVVEANGTAQLLTQPGAPSPGAYIAKSTTAPTTVVSGSPLTFTNISITKLFSGSTFNFNTWTGTSVLPYTLNVNNGTVTSSTGNIYGGTSPSGGGGGGSIPTATIVGTSGADTLNGTSGNDVIDGKAGNDDLNGGTGNDTYLFTGSFGYDYVDDYDTNSSNSDTIIFTDLNSSQATFTRSVDDLIITFSGTGSSPSNKVKIIDYFYTWKSEIENIKFADGIVRDYTWVSANYQ
ncbi:Type 1 glutamine amidotransferase-like domain-containing protein [Paenibacillus roseipurpureus]|uniref:Type 1 glutamine amidotransferase-like domain-containing protein n=1 Tax=Paenibacillus roseopurpureus TaxID=2918901 RepID=A0AA96LRW5_9BACL|nr:Type 1 glutamine amidotransferase-like domain-containing protein [Paenibacillus sp. MBLB1832]WNR46109.1 Type 1 glutamine amidotransferase-like domain-containing protein [Paenibacillus sp. MBLB1832]